MNTKSPKAIVLLAAIAVMLASIGCSLTRSGPRVGSLRTESESVELGDTRSVRVEIEMGAGELDVTGGASELLEADFTYNVAELKPEVEYKGDTLSVRNPDVDFSFDSLWDLDDYRYEWDLRLNDDVSMELRVRLGAGICDLELGSLSLTRLDITRGAGEVTVDLSGTSSLTRLDIGGGAGNLTLDLTGDWQDNLNATIKGGVGNKTVRLPRDVGVRVEVQAGVGKVDASGLTKDGDVYTNDAYGDSEVTLDIEIEIGVGNVDLELE